MLKPGICYDRFKQCLTFFHSVLKKYDSILAHCIQAVFKYMLLSDNIKLPRFPIQKEFDRIHLKLPKI
jgi:hypothetical protein